MKLEDAFNNWREISKGEDMEGVSGGGVERWGVYRGRGWDNINSPLLGQRPQALWDTW